MYSASTYQYRTYQRQRITREYIRMRRRRIRAITIFGVVSILCTLFAIASVIPASTSVTAEPHAIEEVPVVSYEANIEETQIVDEVVATVQSVEVIEEEPEEIPMTQEEILMMCMGDATIEVNGTILTRQETPELDFTTFQPYEDYHGITNTRSAAYKVTFCEEAYTDENGFRRIPVPEDEFNIDGIDDYVVAMGTYYKEKGVCGIRFLIVTDAGPFTVITGDEKADAHTGDQHMYSVHGNEHQYAAVLEYLVDTHKLPNMAARMGSIHYVPFEPLNGTIQMIYRIG